MKSKEKQNGKQKSIQFLESEIKRVQSEIEVLQTAADERIKWEHKYLSAEREKVELERKYNAMKGAYDATAMALALLRQEREPISNLEVQISGLQQKLEEAEWYKKKYLDILRMAQEKGPLTRVRGDLV